MWSRINILTIMLCNKEQTIEQQKDLCEESYFNNPLKFWHKDKPFDKIALLNPSTII